MIIDDTQHQLKKKHIDCCKKQIKILDMSFTKFQQSYKSPQKFEIKMFNIIEIIVKCIISLNAIFIRNNLITNKK